MYKQTPWETPAGSRDVVSEDSGKNEMNWEKEMKQFSQEAGENHK